MPVYRVEVTIKEMYILEVRAESQEEAKVIAYEMTDDAYPSDSWWEDSRIIKEFPEEYEADND